MVVDSGNGDKKKNKEKGVAMKVMMRVLVSSNKQKRVKKEDEGIETLAYIYGNLLVSWRDWLLLEQNGSSSNYCNFFFSLFFLKLLWGFFAFGFRRKNIDD